MFIDFLTQNFIWVFAFLVAANLLVFSSSHNNVKGAHTVSALQLPQLQRNENSVIIDVNSSDVYKKSHIPNALNFPLDSLNTDNNALLKHKKNTTIVVCKTGSLSNKAAKKLVELGFIDLHILKGGLLSWTKENLPLSTS